MRKTVKFSWGEFSTSLLEYFAVDPDFTYGQEIDFTDLPDKIRRETERFIESISTDTIHEFITDPDWWGNSDLFIQSGEKERIKEQIAVYLISKSIVVYRNFFLLDKKNPIMKPYDSDSLENIQVSSEGLIRLQNLEVNNYNIQKNGFVFEIVPVLPDFNSSYWLGKTILNSVSQFNYYVRLDPLTCVPKSQYTGVCYKARVYGQSLNWDEIFRLRDELHGKWMEDENSPRLMHFTEVVWTPRGDEIHFQCEEIPSKEDNMLRGSRYFHSILDKDTKQFKHIDGALRFYSNDELITRQSLHVRNAGKIGQRIKVFRVDGSIPIDLWGELVQSFFFWNNDIINYIATGTNFPEN